MIAVAANEPVAPAVERHSMLAAAGQRRHVERLRIDGEVAVVKIDWFRVFILCDFRFSTAQHLRSDPRATRLIFPPVVLDVP